MFYKYFHSIICNLPSMKKFAEIMCGKRRKTEKKFPPQALNRQRETMMLF